jgi:hypothetical protein
VWIRSEYAGLEDVAVKPGVGRNDEAIEGVYQSCQIRTIASKIQNRRTVTSPTSSESLLEPVSGNCLRNCSSAPLSFHWSTDTTAREVRLDVPPLILTIPRALKT